MGPECEPSFAIGVVDDLLVRARPLRTEIGAEGAGLERSEVSVKYVAVGGVDHPWGAGEPGRQAPQDARFGCVGVDQVEFALSDFAATRSARPPKLRSTATRFSTTSPWPDPSERRNLKFPRFFQI